MRRGRRRSPWLIAFLLLAGLYLAWQEGELQFPEPTGQLPGVSRDTGEVARAYASRQSGVRVSGQGAVVNILPDDLEGSRHQKFLVEVDRGLTVLIAHNIDLAPRVPAIQSGDIIGFHGEYEWNPKGGVIHWTHHDPRGRHPGGWLEFRGERYE